VILLFSAMTLLALLCALHCRVCLCFYLVFQDPPRSVQFALTTNSCCCNNCCAAIYTEGDIVELKVRQLHCSALKSHRQYVQLHERHKQLLACCAACTNKAQYCGSSSSSSSASAATQTHCILLLMPAVRCLACCWGLSKKLAPHPSQG
jgi:hypothetical protein